MAFIDDQDELLNQPKPTSGSVLAGSGGAAAAPGQVTGTGFTNLQKYLTANQGSGVGLANDIISQGQGAVDNARKEADTAADAWADAGAQKANSAAQDVTGQIDSAIRGLEADRHNRQPAMDASVLSYGGPKSATELAGTNDLEAGYKNVRTVAQKQATDHSLQKAGLKSLYGYGSGFAALDTFLGNQDGRAKIQGWASSVNPGSAQGAYDKVNAAIGTAQKSVADAQGRLKQSMNDNAPPPVLPEGTSNPGFGTSRADPTTPGKVNSGGITNQNRMPGTAVAVPVPQDWALPQNEDEKGFSKLKRYISPR